MIINSVIKTVSKLFSNNKKPVIKTIEKVVEEVPAMFNGVKVSDLDKIAKSVHRSNSCKIDQWGFLQLRYKSNRGHSTFTTQFELDKLGNLINLNGGPHYPGQVRSGARSFQEIVNKSGIFKK